MQAETGGQCLLSFRTATLATTWQRFEVATAAAASDGAATLELGLGRSAGTVWIDDVRLQVGDRDVWRRDFDNGVALVNPSASDVTVSLGGLFQTIKGTQVPSVNDGSLVTSVMIPAKDGTVLLRPPDSPSDTANRALTQLASAWGRSASFSEAARNFYVRMARRSTGAQRRRATRACKAWKASAVASRRMRERAVACQAVLARGDVAGAQAC